MKVLQVPGAGLAQAYLTANTNLNAVYYLQNSDQGYENTGSNPARVYVTRPAPPPPTP
jgi:hypothetical protein